MPIGTGTAGGVELATGRGVMTENMGTVLQLMDSSGAVVEFVGGRGMGGVMTGNMGTVDQSMEDRGRVEVDGGAVGEAERVVTTCVASAGCEGDSTGGDGTDAVPFATPTKGLRLTGEQAFEISSAPVELRTGAPSRVRLKVCLPTPMSSWKAEAPAGASNVWVFAPEEMDTVPGVLSSATTNTAS